MLFNRDTLSIINAMRETLCRMHISSMEERIRAIEMRNQLRAELEDRLGEKGLLLPPVLPSARAPYNGEGVWKHYQWLYPGVANVIGFPAISIPIGMKAAEDGGEERMPMSVQLIGRPYSERLLIAAARELERGFRGWTPLDE